MKFTHCRNQPLKGLLAALVEQHIGLREMNKFKEGDLVAVSANDGMTIIPITAVTEVSHHKCRSARSSLGVTWNMKSGYRYRVEGSKSRFGETSLRKIKPDEYKEDEEQESPFIRVPQKQTNA